MKTASTIARYLAGVIFLVFGLNGFLHFIPLPPPSGVAGQFMGALFVSHYLTLIFALQVIGGGASSGESIRAPGACHSRAGYRQHPLLSCSDGPERSPAGPLRHGALGSGIRPCSGGLCRSIPGALPGTGLTDSARFA